MRTLLVLSALGLSAAALAQQKLPAFEEVDENGDGMINEAEASRVAGLDFSVADANKDGGIDREEYGQLS
jgi:Ca2+-binding EF-hand superfamily protein